MHFLPGKRRVKRSVIGLLAIAAVLLLPLAASADLIIPLNTEFSIPGGSGNFGYVTIADVAGVTDDYSDVKFTITYTSPPGSLGSTADLQWFYFNINPNPTSLTDLSIVAYTVPTGVPAPTYTTLSKADGDGTFDYRVDFGDGGTINQNSSFTVSVPNTNLTIANFADGTAATMSALTEGNGTTWTVAAHWQSTNFANATSAFVGGNPGDIAVPLPPSALLLGSGLVGLVGLGWRRRKTNV